MTSSGFGQTMFREGYRGDYCRTADRGSDGDNRRHAERGNEGPRDAEIERLYKRIAELELNQPRFSALYDSERIDLETIYDTNGEDGVSLYDSEPIYDTDGDDGESLYDIEPIYDTDGENFFSYSKSYDESKFEVVTNKNTNMYNVDVDLKNNFIKDDDFGVQDHLYALVAIFDTSNEENIICVDFENHLDVTVLEVVDSGTSLSEEGENDAGSDPISSVGLHEIVGLAKFVGLKERSGQG